MANDFIGPPSILRRVAAAAAGLMIISAGIVAVVRGQSANNNIVYQFERPLKGGSSANSGATVGYVTSSGATAWSGSTLIADQAAASGSARIGGADGGRLCWNDPDGTGCTCISGNDGAFVTWAGTAAECP